MDRLTKPGGSYCDECDVHAGPYATCYMKGCDDEIAMYNRLAAYEDAEEQGRLLVLPCKLGDTVYIVVGTRIHEAKVRHFWYDKNGLVISAVYQFIGPCVYSGEWGKTVFLTREEAEAALGGDTQC